MAHRGFEPYISNGIRQADAPVEFLVVWAGNAADAYCIDLIRRLCFKAGHNESSRPYGTTLIESWNLKTEFATAFCDRSVEYSKWTYVADRCRMFEPSLFTDDIKTVPLLITTCTSTVTVSTVQCVLCGYTQLPKTFHKIPKKQLPTNSLIIYSRYSHAHNSQYKPVAAMITDPLKQTFSV